MTSSLKSTEIVLRSEKENNEKEKDVERRDVRRGSNKSE